MDSTDFQNLKNGLCQIKLEGGDINTYTYYKIKEFWSHSKSFRKHDIQTSTKSINESIKLADQLGCENWKNGIKDQIIPLAMRPWKKIINNNDELLSSSIELGRTNNAIIELYSLDSLVVSNIFTFIKKEELIMNIREEINQKIDSLRAL